MSVFKTKPSEDSPNHGRDWCSFFDGSGDEDTRPNSGDMHGGHVIVTAAFKNVHISHIELFQMGQPTLARYDLNMIKPNSNDLFQISTSLAYVF